MQYYSYTSVAPLLRALRPQQWIKNGLVLAPLLFSLGFLEAERIAAALAACAVFCALSSAAYLCNDLFDRARDRSHPRKRLRPIASGALPAYVAAAAMCTLAVLGLLGAFAIGTSFAVCAALFLALQALYSAYLKHLPIVDVISISLGFVLRVVAGAVAIAVPFSGWILAGVFFLTLFLGVTKREQELRLRDGADSRPVLDTYSPQFLHDLKLVALAATLAVYISYTLSDSPALFVIGQGSYLLGSVFALPLLQTEVPAEARQLLLLTVPVMLFGVMRYYFLLSHKRVDDDGPVDELLHDRMLQAAVLLWAALALGILWFASAV